MDRSLACIGVQVTPLSSIMETTLSALGEDKAPFTRAEDTGGRVSCYGACVWVRHIVCPPVRVDPGPGPGPRTLETSLVFPWRRAVVSSHRPCNIIHNPIVSGYE